MASPATSGGMPSTNSTPRWGRSGEPGSAFNGLSRGGRGGRGRGAARAGRGGTRGGTSTRDSKPDDDHQANTKVDSLQVPSTTAPKPSGSSSFSASPSIPEKSITSSPTSKPAKPPSRRASRTIPPAVTTQIQAAEVVAPPASAKVPNRRKRSQTGKPSAIIPPKINPPAPNDNLLRPNKPRLGPVPHTAPVKDTPPHLNQKIDMRNDIDALVERVRAVAMDHRPTTPGSHIDWAGDDDDSLPDLDDWGVTPATFNANKLDAISPIIVDGLRPLPDLTPRSVPSSPLKHVQTITTTQEISVKPGQKEYGASSSSNTNLNSRPIEKEPEKPTINVPKAVEPAAKEKHVSPVTPKIPKPVANNSNSTSRRPIHPSLPAKPAVGSSFVSPKSRSGAAPMRNTTYPRSPVNATFTDKGSDTKANANQDASNEVPAVNEKEITIAVEQPTANDEQTSKPETPEHLATTESEDSGASDQHKSATSESPSKTEKPAPEGLAASIHAPKAMTDSVSAPANLSTYPDLPSNSSTSLHGFTHTRAHTVGRPPSFPKSAQGEYIPRFARSGHTTPRGGGGGGGFHESYHARTHSSPPAGAMANHLRTHPSSRPVITGDAISRLARTIGRTGASSSSKPQPVVPLGE
ncbi:hypothetical protein CVT25_003437 [Psilocybe cyanescens]|uniref:Uncharacterized protein n=1 Tax=Psilocybe cyanescens TaxID=93625 RepID=A0A409WM03_PSICY|nr:hypothetical protein CVT25_003437 [Psilocybe cyanescens]